MKWTEYEPLKKRRWSLLIVASIEILLQKKKNFVASGQARTNKGDSPGTNPPVFEVKMGNLFKNVLVVKTEEKHASGVLNTHTHTLTYALTLK